jgi:predicted ribosome quality control (RQC) complex YloA/Tae2 family protein
MKEFKRMIDDSNFVNYRLGENAHENHELIDDADKEDWWFHIDGYPSGHCIVEKINIDIEDIKFASNIVKENSKYKNQKNLR